MTGRRKCTATELLDALEASDAADEAERIRTMSDGALDRDLASTGFDPDAVRARGRVAARGRRAAPTPMRSTWIPLLAAAAIGLVVVTAANERRTRVAWFGHELIEKEPIVREPPRPPPAPAPNEVAATLRNEAFMACDRTEWGLCEEKLNEARRLDPGGDDDPRVREARQSIPGAREPANPSSDGKLR